MVVRLISTIITLVLIAFFAGFNLDNKCDVNLLFYTFKNTPVFFTVIFSFIIGIIFTIPFAFFFRIGKKNKKSTDKKDVSIHKTQSGISNDIKKKTFFNRKNSKDEKVDIEKKNIESTESSDVEENKNLDNDKVD